MSDLVVTSVHAEREDAIAHAVAELAAEGGGELLVHHADCGTGRGEACSCTPDVHLIRPGGRA